MLIRPWLIYNEIMIYMRYKWIPDNRLNERNINPALLFYYLTEILVTKNILIIRIFYIY